VIIPAYNERENVTPLFEALSTAFTTHSLKGEIVFVDDGSNDGTFEIAEAEVARIGPHARVVRHGRNVGKTEAILTGAQCTDRTFVVLLDADLQYAPDDIVRFLDALDDGWDIVAGRKVGPYEKAAVSRTYNWLSSRLFGLPVRDGNAMKGCRRAVLLEIPLRHNWHRFLVALAHVRGHRLTEIDVPLYPRRAGTPKFASRSRVLGGVTDLLVVWFALRVSTKPLHVFGGIGLVSLALGFLIGAVTLALRAAHVPPPPIGYRPILGLIVLLLLAGVTLFAVGVVAELVAVLHAEIESLRKELRASVRRN
jgi:glycosyltransferase involved in cell wall biosynthesis